MEPKGQTSAFAPTTWWCGFVVCVVLNSSMLVVFILNPWLVYTCVHAVLPQLWALSYTGRVSSCCKASSIPHSNVLILSIFLCCTIGHFQFPVSLGIQPRKQDFCPLRTHPEVQLILQSLSSSLSSSSRVVASSPSSLSPAKKSSVLQALLLSARSGPPFFLRRR